jgi:hypothetical protein
MNVYINSGHKEIKYDGVAILVGHAEQFGTIFVTRILSLVLILYGMQMIFFGIMGKSALQKC